MSKAFQEAVETITPLQRRVLASVASTHEEIAVVAKVDPPTTRNTLGWLASKGLVRREGKRWVRTDSVRLTRYKTR